ncbi:hypothetical protein FQZ97_723150 [compost metagenome]
MLVQHESEQSPGHALDDIVPVDEHAVVEAVMCDVNGPVGSRRKLHRSTAHFRLLGIPLAEGERQRRLPGDDRQCRLVGLGE